MYNFRRFGHGRDKGAYYHNCFIHGQEELCRGILRTKVKGNAVRKPCNLEEEPNFYFTPIATNEKNTMMLPTKDLKALSYPPTIVSPPWAQSMVSMQAPPAHLATSYQALGDQIRSSKTEGGLKNSDAMAAASGPSTSPVQPFVYLTYNMVPIEEILSFLKNKMNSEGLTQSNEEIIRNYEELDGRWRLRICDFEMAMKLVRLRT